MPSKQWGPEDSGSRPLTAFVVGGAGGSGTRLVAQILGRTGLRLGPLSRGTWDNVLFAALVTLPCGRAGVRSMPELGCAFRASDFPLFLRAMRGDVLSSREVSHIRRSVDAIPLQRWVDHTEVDSALQNRLAHPSRSISWKDPTTALLLPYLKQEISDLRYIHVIRNGLDMAFSGNQNQLHAWGGLFGIPGLGWKEPWVTPAGEWTPEKSFSYWLSVNEYALEVARDLPPGTFHLVSFDELCSSPAAVISDLWRFVTSRPPSAEVLTSIVGLVSPPATIGRYRDKDTSFITRDSRQRLERLGFEV